MNASRTHLHNERVLPKLCGSDTELGNFVLGVESASGSGYHASRALLEAIEGFPMRRRGLFDSQWAQPSRWSKGLAAGSGGDAVSGWSGNLQDVGRRFLAGNGSAAYIDLDHLEMCTPEVLSAFDLVAAGHAMLRIARGALQTANERSGRRIQVLANNSDGLGNSYGSHINFLLSRAAYNDIFFRKPHYLAYLASFQISSILLTGQGKIGAENDRPATPFQLSSRADFFERIQGIETTYNRPVCNTRDEPLCGVGSLTDPAAPARLHVIFFDSPLAHGSALFRAGLMQMTLAAIECGRINSRLILDHPLQALYRFSRDPTLAATAPLIGGERVTIVELQSAYAEEARRLFNEGVFEGVVPRAGEILSLWEDALARFTSGDVFSLAPRLDWVMKLMAIERALDENPRLDWDSPDIKLVDHLYSNLDCGLFFAYQESGFTESLVPDELIGQFVTSPPADTRAWTRSMLLRRAAEEDIEVDLVDWDRITFRLRGRHGWPTYRTLEMANPLQFSQAAAGAHFAAEPDFSALLDALDELGSAAANSESSAAVPYQTGGNRNALSQSPR